MPSCQAEAHKLRRQVSTLSEFGKRALRSDDIDGLLQEATRLVSDAIDVDLVKVLELLPGGENLLVRAGVNWNPGVVGQAKIPAHEGSSAGYALHKNQPVITEDTERENRFEIPELLSEHSVRSTVNVVIRGEDGPFGVLEVDSRQLRKFEQDDIDFLQNYANLLASAIDRARIHRELAERALRLEILGHELQHRINNVLATINAIARRTRAKSQSLEEFANAFDDRLAAIARTHALLSQTRTGTIDIREVLCRSSQCMALSRVKISSSAAPRFRFKQNRPRRCQWQYTSSPQTPLSTVPYLRRMVALRYRWDVHDHDNKNEFRLDWREWGSPISHNPSRRGFGSEFLDKLLPKMLHGEFERKFRSDGIECTISFVLAHN